MGDEVSYTTKDVYVMEQIEHIRNSTGMYVGSTETATRLVEELLDNALDEVQAGYCDYIEIIINSKENTVSILDNGRGIPFNQELPEEEDPPIMTATKLFSSGKFDKKDGGAYQIASGLHGVGLVAVNALSDWMTIEINRNRKCGKYKFIEATKKIKRSCSKLKKNDRPSSTKIVIKPSEKYFMSINVDVDTIEERLRIASANFENLTIYLKVDDISYEIKGETEDGLIKEYLTDSEDLEWICFENKKGSESCHLRLSWDIYPPITNKIFSCVNLVHVHSGVHIKFLHDAIKNVFVQLAKKYKYEFKPEDCFSYMRCYLNMKIIKTSFEAQVKVKLESKSDLSIMKPIETYLKKYLEDNNEFRTNLLEGFQAYRKSLQSKKVVKIGKSRSATKFTKLRDCRDAGGELLIGEGDSAVGGLLHVRDSKKHAILPLRGVVMNVLKNSDWHKNTEVTEIIQALGTGVGDDCDLSKLRYSKIILAADADPAGSFITTLLIVLFAKLVPEIIKSGKLYICVTPLHGTRKNGKLVPLWTKEDLIEARSANMPIKRFKGLGEFSPEDLKVFTLDVKTRRLIQVGWSNKYENLFKLMTSSSEKRKLVMGTWDIDG